MRPKCSNAASTTAWAPADVETSLVSATAVPPPEAISAATSSAGTASAPSPSMLPPRSFTTTARATCAQEQCVGPPDAPARAGDGGDAPVEAVVAQVGPLRLSRS